MGCEKEELSVTKGGNHESDSKVEGLPKYLYSVGLNNICSRKNSLEDAVEAEKLRSRCSRLPF